MSSLGSAKPIFPLGVAAAGSTVFMLHHKLYARCYLSMGATDCTIETYAYSIATRLIADVYL